MRLNILFHDAIWRNSGHWSNIPKCLLMTPSRPLIVLASSSTCASVVRPACGFLLLGVRAGVRYAANTIEEMQKLLRGYRDNMRVEIEAGIAVTASTVAELRALPTWPNGSVLNIHIDLDPRFSVVRVERAS